MINTDLLQQTVIDLLAPGKGILAADESTSTIEKRFAESGIENIEENRRAYRELLFTSPGIEKYISGVILFDETFGQAAATGKMFVDLLREKGIVAGIKVDLGTEDLENCPGEVVTKGIETLAERLPDYFSRGARFAKWRAVFSISKTTPSTQAIEVNVKLLAQYALLCQQNGIVPIVEPEVLMDGAHSIEQCLDTTVRVQTALFAALRAAGVELSCVLLKPNMVLPGEGALKVTPEKVAEFTLRCLRETVPPEVPGIVFLSGGQSEVEATENLRAINAAKGDLPQALTFSYGRALQASALVAWQGRTENVAFAQAAFLEHAKQCSEAARGHY